MRYMTHNSHRQALESMGYIDRNGDVDEDLKWKLEVGDEVNALLELAEDLEVTAMGPYKEGVTNGQFAMKIRSLVTRVIDFDELEIEPDAAALAIESAGRTYDAEAFAAAMQSSSFPIQPALEKTEPKQEVKMPF